MFVDPAKFWPVFPEGAIILSRDVLAVFWQQILGPRSHHGQKAKSWPRCNYLHDVSFESWKIGVENLSFLLERHEFGTDWPEFQSRLYAVRDYLEYAGNMFWNPSMLIEIAVSILAMSVTVQSARIKTILDFWNTLRAAWWNSRISS